MMDEDTPLDRQEDPRLQIVLNAMPLPVTWARLDDARIVFMNRKFTQVFGYKVGDFETVPEWVEKAYPIPEQRKRAEESWYEFFGNPTLDEFEVEPVEVDVLCKDGRVVTTILSGIILPQAGIALATFIDITERKRNELLVKQLAEEDALTALPNRRALDAHLERTVADAMREQKPMHLLLLDLDYFKAANDTYGHEIGDMALKEVARRLQYCVRSGDVVARLGGDEFAIILPKSGNDANAAWICEKIISTIKRPFTLNGYSISLGVSIGMAAVPAIANDAQGVLRAADQALYTSKHRGRGTWTQAQETHRGAG